MGRYKMSSNITKQSSGSIEVAGFGEAKSQEEGTGIKGWSEGQINQGVGSESLSKKKNAENWVRQAVNAELRNQTKGTGA